MAADGMQVGLMCGPRSEVFQQSDTTQMEAQPPFFEELKSRNTGLTLQPVSNAPQAMKMNILTHEKGLHIKRSIAYF